MFRYDIYFSMLFYVLYAVFYLGISIATIIEYNTPQSQYIALHAKNGITTLIMAIIDVITTFHVLGLLIAMTMRLNVRHGQKVGLIVVSLSSRFSHLSTSLWYQSL